MRKTHQYSRGLATKLHNKVEQLLNFSYEICASKNNFDSVDQKVQSKTLFVGFFFKLKQF